VTSNSIALPDPSLNGVPDGGNATRAATVSRLRRITDRLFVSVAYRGRHLDGMPQLMIVRRATFGVATDCGG